MRIDVITDESIVLSNLIDALGIMIEVFDYVFEDFVVMNSQSPPRSRR